MNIHGKILHTKEKLYTSLNDLIQFKDISHISVTELCEKANINRSTFYRYYSLPQNVLDEQVSSLINDALENASKHYFDDPVKDIHHKMIIFCRSYYENRFLTRLYNDLNENVYLYIKKFIHNSTLPNNEELEDNIIFIAGGFISIFNAWSKSGFKRKPEVVAEILTKQITRFS